MHSFIRGMRSWKLSCAIVMSFLLTSCQSKGPKLFPVTGQIFFEDQPASGATVVFHLKGGSGDTPKPGATVQPDGTFTLNTYPHGAGAPEGDYIVIATWLEDGKAEGQPARNRLPVRYSDPAQSGLQVTIRPETNKLEPFRLTQKAK